MSRTIEAAIIEQVRVHEVLYNSKSHNYRDQELRQQAWDEIARELNVPALAAKNCWEKLRRCFLNALSRRRAKSEDAANNMPPWKFAAQMQFVLPHIGSNGGGGRKIKSKPEAQKEEPGNEDTEDLDWKFQDVEDSDTSESNYSNKDTFSPAKRSSSESNTNCKDTDRLQENAMAKRSKFETSLMDETEMFFMSMAKMTKMLPNLEQLKIKKDLSEAVFNAQFMMHQLPPSPSDCTKRKPTAWKL